MATFSGKLDQLLKIAREANSKEAFVDPAAASGAGGDPMAGGAPPMDPAMMGMDPAMMGGAPPMDPAMMGGMPPMDPAMMGGMPPMDPAMMGMDPAMMGMDPAMMGGMPPLPPEGDSSGGGITAEEVRTIIQEEMGGKSETKSTGSSKQSETDAALKQINFLLAKIADVLGISISAQDIVEDPAAGEAPAAASEEYAPQSTFANIEPIEAYPTAVKTSEDGEAYDASGLFEMTNKASALAHVLNHRKNRK